MLTVITPATSTALTTVARATAMIGLDASHAAALALAIPQASQAAVDHCRRPFAQETVREVFDHPSPRGVLLARAPATAIASVTRGETALTVDDWRYDPATGLLQPLVGAFVGCWYAAPLTVEYTAGYTLPTDSGTWTLPPAVERAAVLLIGAMLDATERDPLMRSEEIPGVRAVTWWVPDTKGLPSPEAERLLEPYRRIVG